jgi:hypothetical protein
MDGPKTSTSTKIVPSGTEKGPKHYPKEQNTNNQPYETIIYENRSILMYHTPVEVE